MTAPVRNSEAVVVAVTFRRRAGVGTSYDWVRKANSRAGRSLIKPGSVGNVDALAVLGAGRVLDQQGVGQAGHLPEQAKHGDKTRHVPGSPAPHPILRRAKQTNLRA
ncbi:MAG TPA: hypothetical protein VFH73_10500 [Polyangia bacterium]|nr:hypothetical protein [Polyangia bacterium]